MAKLVIEQESPLNQYKGPIRALETIFKHLDTIESKDYAEYLDTPQHCFDNLLDIFYGTKVPYPEIRQELIDHISTQNPSDGKLLEESFEIITDLNEFQRLASFKYIHHYLHGDLLFMEDFKEYTAKLDEAAVADLGWPFDGYNEKELEEEDALLNRLEALKLPKIDASHLESLGIYNAQYYTTSYSQYMTYNYYQHYGSNYKNYAGQYDGKGMYLYAASSTDTDLKDYIRNLLQPGYDISSTKAIVRAPSDEQLSLLVTHIKRNAGANANLSARLNPRDWSLTKIGNRPLDDQIANSVNECSKDPRNGFANLLRKKSNRP